MKTSEELQNMKVVDLRSYAKELGIKNAKTYQKVDLVKKIEEVQNELQPKVEEPVIEESAKSIEINPMITEEPSFYEFVKKYNGSIEIQKDSAKIEIIFSNKENYKAAVQEYKNNKKFKTNFYCFDNFLHSIILYSKKSVERKKRTESDIPNGPQSLAIYNMMIEHPTWTHYKIKSLLNCTYTNVRRVYLKYIKGTEYDKR
jgi:uncharacterized protein (DUF1697 family)